MLRNSAQSPRNGICRVIGRPVSATPAIAVGEAECREAKWRNVCANTVQKHVNPEEDIAHTRYIYSVTNIRT